MAEKTTVLIVEDEAMAALMLQKTLNLLGYQVYDPVATGQDAVSSAEKENPDVILMDIRLPGDMDGIQAAQEIISHRKTPIIFMTGYTDPEIKQRAKALNPVAYLTKPMHMNEVRSAIDLAVQNGKCVEGRAS